jgi:preprotein translocase subunit SecG
MYLAISIILILLSFLLVVIVLVQPGKGDMISGISGISGQFNSILGSSAASTFLVKFTWGLAIAIGVLIISANVFFVGTGQTSSAIKAPTEGMSVPVNTVPVNLPPAVPAPAESNPTTPSE